MNGGPNDGEAAEALSALRNLKSNTNNDDNNNHTHTNDVTPHDDDDEKITLAVADTMSEEAASTTVSQYQAHHREMVSDIYCNPGYEPIDNINAPLFFTLNIYHATESNCLYQLS